MNTGLVRCVRIAALVPFAVLGPSFLLAQAPVITITTLPSEFAGLTRDDPFTLQMAVSGPDATYHWSIVNGVLPPGLHMTSLGLISGAPEQKGVYQVTFRATDVASQSSGTKAYTLSVYAVPKPEPIDLPYTLAAIYMPKPSWPSHQWGDLRLQNEKNAIKATHGQRVPLLGFYRGDSPEVLDWQIKMAVDRGITTFSFHDYWTENFDRPTYDTGLQAFLAARYRGHMSFAVVFNYCRTVANNSASKQACLLNKVLPYYVSHYFSHANYFRVDGKPVIQLLNVSDALGTASAVEIQTFMQAADAYIAQHTTYAGAYWVTYDIADASIGYTFANVAAFGFDAVATGAVLPYLWPAANGALFPILNPGPFGNENWPPGEAYGQAMTSGVQMQGRNFAQAQAHGLKYFTSVTPDFDSRWIYWAQNHLYYSGQTQGLYNGMLSSVRDLVGANVNVLPVSSNTGKPVVGLGSWNEQGESSTIEPGFSVFQLESDTTDGPYFIANAIANHFGGTGTYDAYLPDDYSRGFPNKTHWSFSTATGAGLDEWATTTTAGLEIGPSDDLVVTGLHAIHLTTAVYRRLANHQSARIRVRIINPDAPLRIEMHAYSSDYSANAMNFGTPPELGRRFWEHVDDTPVIVPQSGGYADYVFDLAPGSESDVVKMLQFRLLIPSPNQTQYSIKGIWLD